MTDFFKREHPLENERARLEPLTEDHYPPLLSIAMNRELWAYTSVKVNSASDFRRYFDQAMQEKQQQLAYPYAIFDKREQRYGGSTRFGNISLENKRMEIGWTWYHPDLQRTGLNRACKFLLLSYGFEQLGLNRIELKTSLLNNKSQEAMLGIGAVKEGIFRNHMINEDCTIRHSVFFSFIIDEWEQTKLKYFSAFI